jgi:hypothetical protein
MIGRPDPDEPGDPLSVLSGCAFVCCLTHVPTPAPWDDERLVAGRCACVDGAPDPDPSHLEYAITADTAIQAAFHHGDTIVLPVRLEWLGDVELWRVLPAWTGTDRPEEDTP